jgi:hypothetical protein
MTTDTTPGDPDICIRDLYPRLNEEESKQAEENLKRYVELELRVYERILADPEAYARFKALTASHLRRTVPDKGRAFLNNRILHSGE